MRAHGAGAWCLPDEGALEAMPSEQMLELLLGGEPHAAGRFTSLRPLDEMIDLSRDFSGRPGSGRSSQASSPFDFNSVMQTLDNDPDVAPALLARLIGAASPPLQPPQPPGRDAAAARVELLSKLPPGWSIQQRTPASGRPYLIYRGPAGQRAVSVSDAWRKHGGEAAAATAPAITAAAEAGPSELGASLQPRDEPLGVMLPLAPVPVQRPMAVPPLPLVPVPLAPAPVPVPGPIGSPSALPPPLAPAPAATASGRAEGGAVAAVSQTVVQFPLWASAGMAEASAGMAEGALPGSPLRRSPLPSSPPPRASSPPPSAGGGSAKLGVPHALLSALPPPLPPRTPRRAEEEAGQGEEEEGGSGAEGWHLSASSGSASSLIALLSPSVEPALRMLEESERDFAEGGAELLPPPSLAASLGSAPEPHPAPTVA